MSAPEAGLEVGTVMKDGTVYAGVSPATGKLLFVMPEDAPLMDYDATVDHVEALNREKTYGHSDWRIPTERELKVIHANKERGALKGTFNETGLGAPFQPVRGRIAAGQYRATDWGGQAGSKSVIFSEGTGNYILRMEPCSVRYIREDDMPELPAPPPAPYATPNATTARQERLNRLGQAYKPKLKP